MMKPISLGLTPRACFAAAAMLLGISLFWFRAPLQLISRHASSATPAARIGVVVALCALGIACWGIGRLFRARRARLPAQHHGEEQKTDIPLTGNKDKGRDKGRAAASIPAPDWGFGAARRFVGQGGPWWRLRRNSAYRLPWYVLLGSADSGKSALMRASGLAFAKADDGLSAGEPSSPCQWWFADEAVLLEPRGASVWTIHDAQEQDRSDWRDFLRRLKRARRRCPLNGALVPINAATLLAHDEDARIAQAEALRSRLRDMQRELGMRVPVYIVVTQCDRLEGFSAYFNDLGAAQREQVLGLTFPVEDDGQVEQSLQAFARRFGEIAQRLQMRVVDRICTGDDNARRAEIHGFPVQFEILGPPLARFLKAAFGPSPYAPSAWLRGAYFTSAVQDTPARALSVSPLAAKLRAMSAPLRHAGPSSRGYFITGMLRQLVFQECGLAGRRSAFVPRAAGIRYGVPAGILLCAVLVGVVMHVSEQRVRALIARTGQATTELAALADQGARFDQPATLLPLLDAAGKLQTIAQASPSVPGLWRTGFAEGPRLAEVARAKYLAVLKDTIIPFIGHRLREQLRQNSLGAAQRYWALRIYLMLGTPQRYDADAVLRWVSRDLNQAPLTRRQREALLMHARTILESPGFTPNLPLDAGLLARSRAALAGQPIVDRTFADIRQQLDEAIPAPLSLAQMAGVNAPLVLSSKSGRPLTDGVPGAYTLEGYRRYQALRDAELRIVEKDAWVSGGDPTVQGETQRSALAVELDNAYLAHYIEAWDNLLGDVRLTPLPSSTDGSGLVMLLAGSDSPLRKLLEAAATQTTLGPTEHEDGSAAAATSPGPNAPQGAGTASGARAVRTLGPQGAVDADRMMASARDDWMRVNLHFDALHRLVAKPAGGGPSPMDGVAQSLNETGMFLRAIDAARQRGLPLPAGDGFDKLRNQAKGLPAPVRDMLLGLSDSAESVTFAKERTRLSDLWRANVAPFCHAALDHRYPLDPYSSVDVTLDDFARVFAPGGLIDAFFQTNLQPYVDTGTNPWRWRPGAATPRMPDDVLFEFQQAAAIRDAFFPNGAKSMSVRFQLVPRSLDTGITRFTLMLDGQSLDYSHGPEQPVSFQWPSPDVAQMARVSYETASSTEPRAYTIEGPWALFRLLDRANVERTQVDRFNLSFDLDGKDGQEATVELDASSVLNPFALAALRQFRCLDHL